MPDADYCWLLPFSCSWNVGLVFFLPSQKREKNSQPTVQQKKLPSQPEAKLIYATAKNVWASYYNAAK
jgi:hypothetical protein